MYSSHHRGPTFRDLGKFAVGALVLFGRASAQSGGFLGGTLVPNVGGVRGGPRPQAPGPSLAPSAFAPSAFGFAPSEAPIGAGAPNAAIESMVAQLASSAHPDALDSNQALQSTRPELISIPLYGCPSADYSGLVTVGEQNLFGIMDTGSGALVVASNLCNNCNLTLTYTLSAQATDLETPVSLLYGSAKIYGGEVQDTVAIGNGPRTPLIFADATSQQNRRFKFEVQRHAFLLMQK